MFQFPALASCYARCHSFRMTGCPIRKSSDQRLFAPTRSLSQLITSFIASESQGIRHAPLLTFSLTDNVWSIYTFSFNFTFFVTSCQRSFYQGLTMNCQLLNANATGNMTRVENNGFEPLTPCVQSRCSSQLS